MRTVLLCIVLFHLSGDYICKQCWQCWPYEGTRRGPQDENLGCCVVRARCSWSLPLVLLWVSVFPTLDAYSEFAVTALSKGSRAQVILTWSLQVTALSKGWHRTCSFTIFLEDANSEFAVHCLIRGLLCPGHTDSEFAVHCLIRGLTLDIHMFLRYMVEAGWAGV